VATVVGVPANVVTGDLITQNRRKRQLSDMKEMFFVNLNSNITREYALTVTSNQTSQVVTKKVKDAIDSGLFFRDLRQVSGATFGTSSVATVVDVTPIPPAPTASPSTDNAENFVKKKSGMLVE
jgi:D-aminopeptidase